MWTAVLVWEIVRTKDLDGYRGTVKASQLMDRWGFSCKYNIWDGSTCFHLHTRSPWLVYKWINPALLGVQQLLLGHSQQQSFIHAHTHAQIVYRSQLHHWHYHATIHICVCTNLLMYSCVALYVCACESVLLRVWHVLMDACFRMYTIRPSPPRCWLVPPGKSSRWHPACTGGDICTSYRGSFH